MIGSNHANIKQKPTITCYLSYLRPLYAKNTKTYDVANQCPVFRKEETCGGVKSVNMLPNRFLSW